MRAVRSTSRAWRATPALWFVQSESLGEVHVSRKGGCCLAYMAHRESHDHVDDELLDDEHKAWKERFPEDPATQTYCSTCSFRSTADVAERQVFWHERKRLAT
jgi:hypothetical protein